MSTRGLSPATLEVLRLLLDHPGEPLYGLQIMKLAGVKSGTLYPILDRLETRGWIVGDWEQTDPRAVGRPRRRTYTLTGEGERAASQAIADMLRRITPRPVGRPGLAT